MEIFEYDVFLEWISSKRNASIVIGVSIIGVGSKAEIDSVFCDGFDCSGFLCVVSSSEMVNLMLVKECSGELDPSSSSVIGMIIGKGEEELIVGFEVEEGLDICRI
ncbi:MAG: hypothetical protein Q4B28_02455 [bacterium]|nr:hypothetical protein [bacterium]